MSEHVFIWTFVSVLMWKLSAEVHPSVLDTRYISSSSIIHGVGPLVDPFRSHASRSLFNGLPWFLLPAGEYCFIHNEELNDLYSSPNIVRVIKSRRLRWAGHVARMGEGRGVHKVLVGKPEGKRPVGIPRRRWEDNIKMDLQEVGRGSGDWMELAQDRDGWRALGSTVMNFGVR